MKLSTGWSTHPDAETAAAEAFEMARKSLDQEPKLLLLHSSPVYDNAAVLARLRALAPEIPLHGGTTCYGVLTREGVHIEDGRGLGILALEDPQGDYGVGMAKDEGDPVVAAHTALNQALVEADRPGEVPAVILISSYPGCEESVIQAIEETVGSGVPIIGGTSADNDMSGQWLQFGNGELDNQSISIATLFPSCDIGYAFHGSYDHSEYRGRVTKAEGRVLLEIDGRPAARVYNEWTQGKFADLLAEGGSLVPAASFSPLGTEVGRVNEIPYFRLSYPVEVLENQALQLFTNVREGSEVVLMTGSRDSLATRAGRVANVAIDAADFSAEEVQGALILFCTGCMLTIEDRLEKPVADLKATFKNAPFLTTFTLGEQGCFIGGENRHANLMVAALVFGPIKA